MAEPKFSGFWFIRSSTSRFFPAHSILEIKEKGSGSEFELEVTWENDTKLKVIEKDFLLKDGALQGNFSHPKEKSKEQTEFQLVVTLCPVSFEDGRRRLFGLLLPPSGRIADEGTGVWVAEAGPREEPPGGSA